MSARPAALWTRRPTAEILAACALVAGLVALHAPVLFAAETWIERDALRYTLPARQELAGALAAGRFPEWSDAVGFGNAFAANPLHLATHPAGWLAALGGSSRALDAWTVGLLAVAGLGTAALSRRFGAERWAGALAGFALAASGYATSMIASGGVPTIAALPWVAWAADRLADRLREPVSGGREDRHARLRAAALFATTLALQWMVGEPASALLAVLLSAAVVAARASRSARAWGTLGAAALAALPLSAAALAPGAALFRDSARAAGLAGDGLAWSLHPARLLETVWPSPFGSPASDSWFAGLALSGSPGDPFWSFSLFLGAPILFLALAGARGRRGTILLLSAAGFVLLAFGRHNPLYVAALEASGAAGWINFPEKFVFGALLLVAALAGAGLSRLESERPPRYPAIGSAAVGLALLAASAAVAGRHAELLSGLGARAEPWGVSLNFSQGLDAAARGGALAAGAALLFSAAVVAGRRGVGRTWRRAAIAVAVAAPLVVAVAEIAPHAPRALVERTPVAAATAATAAAASPRAPRPRLLRIPPPGRLAAASSPTAMARAIEETLDTNVGARFGLTVLPGFDSAETAASRRFWLEVGQRLPLPVFVDLLGVDWILAERVERLRPPLAPTRRLDGDWSLVAARPARPRGFVAPRWLGFAERQEALHSLLDPRRWSDPALIAVDGAPDTERSSAAPLTPCEVLVERPEKVAMRCDSPEGGYAVLLEAAAPGWRAAVDGTPVELSVAEGLFRAVRIAPGPRRIEFSYRAPGLRSGAAVAAGAWVALALLAVRARERRPGRPKES